MGLSAFLKPERTENIRFAASARFKAEDGSDELWEIKQINAEQDDRLRREACGAGGFDGVKYMAALAAACTVYPNLKSEELQNAYRVMGEEKLLKTMLNPGEYADYCLKVQEINGFERSADELVDEAKN